jgi:hypothetical protein
MINVSPTSNHSYEVTKTPPQVYENINLSWERIAPWSSNGSLRSFDPGPNAVYIEYPVTPRSKLAIKIIRTVAVSIIHLTLKSVIFYNTISIVL